MAANIFATMLHRNTNKLTLVLVYAFLEWVLIVLLLLNSLFSYLILKFADFFALSRPCLWCSRIDHAFEPAQKRKFSYRDLVCDHHASEMGQLGYCSNHRKLAESRHLCEDCSSSSRPSYWKCMKQIRKVFENGEVGFVSMKCSCCGVSVDESKLLYPCVLMKPSLGVYDYTHEKGLIAEAGVVSYDQPEEEEEEEHQGIGKCKGIEMDFDVDEGDSAVLEKEDIDEIGKEQDLIKLDDDDNHDLSISVDNMRSSFDFTMDASPEIMSPHLEFFIGHDDHRLIPVVLINSVTEEKKIQYTSEEANQNVALDFDVHVQREAEAEIIVETSCTKEDEEPLVPRFRESEDEAQLAGVELDQLVENEEVVGVEEDELIINAQATEFLSADRDEVEETVKEMDAASEEEDTEIQNDEIEADVSIGTEIPDHEQFDDYLGHEDPLTSHEDMLTTDYDYGSERVEQEVEFKTISVETIPHPLFSQLSRSLELSDFEEDKVPDSPSSVDSVHGFNRKLLSLERIQFGTEYLDGSVISDIEIGEPSIEKLTSALRAERKALHAMYAELEEERSASAVAANQTMAMINRLHEEKAAMQMEALQYQRMMEEQTEYDQEALQLLNELMMKSEKEKQELQKELEAYQKKVQEYEARERMLMLRRKEARIRSVTSSVSCRNAEDSDGSVDLNREAKEDDCHFSHQNCDNNHSTPTDAVLYLEDSLANFEEERMSISEDLKALEGRLLMMNNEVEEHFSDVKSFENNHENANSYNVNGEANGHQKEINGKQHQVTRMLSKPKRLLPLFNAIELEAEDGVSNENKLGFDSASQPDSSNLRIKIENKRPAFEEEVDHVYERLQALEADRELLKHCMSSLKKGDKGLYLLQEILQHLHDLWNVELCARNMEDVVVESLCAKIEY